MRYPWHRIRHENGMKKIAGRRSRFNWRSPRSSSESTLSEARSLDFRRRPPRHRARRARFAQPRPRNRVPTRPARRLHRDSAVSPRMGSTVAERLYQAPGRPQRSSTGRRTRRRILIARSQRSKIGDSIFFLEIRIIFSSFKRTDCKCKTKTLKANDR